MTEKTEQQQQEHDFGPGALLKQTREKKGLSLEEVSTRLKLTSQMLKKIEADDYEGELPATFYRGYLKNYAEFLELDEVDICANFRDFCGKNNLFSAPPPKLQGLELDKPTSSSNWLFKAVTTVIILALLFAIYYMVVEKELWKKFVPESSEEQTQSVDGLQIGSQDNSQLDIEGANAGDANADSDNGELPFSDAPREESPSEANTGDSSSNTEGELNLNEGATSGPVNSGDDQASMDNSASQSSSLDNRSSSQVASGGSLTLNFTGDCWVRIQDASGKVLALGIKSAGTSLQLSGQTPYNLTLGKASAVQLSYNGNAVDLSGYSDERAAKLTLGDNS